MRRCSGSAPGCALSSGACRWPRRRRRWPAFRKAPSWRSPWPARHDGIAGRVLAFGGCLVQPLHAAPAHTTLHLFHGAADRVIPADGSRRAFGQIGALQGDATIDIADDVGHELHPALIDRALFRLRNHIPLRTWRAALGAAAASVGGGGR
jgi:phospholipase/carboxylesterase